MRAALLALVLAGCAPAQSRQACYVDAVTAYEEDADRLGRACPKGVDFGACPGVAEREAQLWQDLKRCD